MSVPERADTARAFLSNSPRWQVVSSDIIAAIATPPGKGGIGVVRVSGKNLHALVLKMVGSALKPRHATFCKFLDESGIPIDQGIALYFRSPHSYTGEDVLELQGHGGTAVTNLVLSSCLRAGARLAQPGEFTLRAFFNDKIDLAQAESVADIVNARTGEAVRCALRSLKGEFSAAIHSMVRALTELRMTVEADLDFPEEYAEDAGHPESSRLPVDTRIGEKLEALQSRLSHVLAAARQGSLLREGMSIVIAGQPNVGKSSLLNRLAREDVAIVTDIPGTTRDAISQSIEVEGIPLRLTDTAGLRETTDAVEKEGIGRTRMALSNADLVLMLMDCRSGMTAEDEAILDSLPRELPVLRIYNKTDLAARNASSSATDAEKQEIYLSAKTGSGIELLRSKLAEIAGQKPGAETEGMFMARQRHLEDLMRAGNHVQNALDLVGDSSQSVFLAEELRLAQQSLSSITGEFTADDLLGEIFSRFCIGK
jgi:tRNA modification GTPase